LATPIGLFAGDEPAAFTCLSALNVSASHTHPTLTITHNNPARQREREKWLFALRKTTAEPPKPKSQTIKLDASGKATRWQG
jgi:hypothetical protein